MDAPRVNEAHAVLNTGAAVRNFREVAKPEFFLLFETKWTMIGRDDLQMIAFQAIPQFLLVPFFAQRWREDILGSFEAGHVEVF